MVLCILPAFPLWKNDKPLEGSSRDQDMCLCTVCFLRKILLIFFSVSPEIPASEDLFFQANRSQANLVSMNLFGMKVHVLFSIPFFLASILTHSWFVDLSLIFCLKADLCIPTKRCSVHSKCNVVTSEVSSNHLYSIFNDKIKAPQVSSANQLDGVDLNKDGELCGVADRDLVPSPSLHLVLVDNLWKFNLTIWSANGPLCYDSLSWYRSLDSHRLWSPLRMLCLPFNILKESSRFCHLWMRRLYKG